jgi:phosphonate transport system substrate-binding protein
VRTQSIRNQSILFALLVFFFFPALLPARELVYIPLPIDNQEAVVTAHTPMIRYLSEKLGVTIRIRYEKDNHRIFQLFKEGKVDLVQLGPLPYTTLKKEYARTQALAIMNEADGKPCYTCALVTSFDGPQSVEKINSPLALTQFFSTCGHFSASLLLKKHDLELEKLGYEYLGTHENVALAVVRGEFTTGSMKTAIARRYENLTLKILAETPPFPGFVIAGNTVTLTPEQLRQISDLLIQATPEVRASWKAGRHGFSPVSDNDFEQFTRSMHEGF